MITALIRDHSTAVQVIDSYNGTALVSNLGRGNLGQIYAGGWGYTGSKHIHVTPAELEAVTRLDADGEDLLRNWRDAMAAVDAIDAQEDSDLFMDAIAIEDEARQAYIEHIEAMAYRPVAVGYAPIAEPATV